MIDEDDGTSSYQAERNAEQEEKKIRTKLIADEFKKRKSVNIF